MVPDFSNVGQGLTDEIGGVLAHVVRYDADSRVGRYIADALIGLAAEHHVPLDRIQSFWQQLLGAIVADPAGQPSKPDAEEFGAWFAEQGYSLTDSLQVVLGLRAIAMEAVHRQVRLEGRPAALSISGIELLSVWMNEFSVGFNAGYFAVELANRARQRSQHNAMVSSLLLGTGPDDDGLTRLGAYGLEVGETYRAFRARPSTNQELAALERYLDINQEDEPKFGLSTVIDGDVCGLVEDVPDEPAPILIGVSHPVPITDLPNAFRRATRAFHVGQRAGLSGVHSMEGLGILVSVVADGDVADVLRETYLDHLEAMGAPGETLLKTLECFLRNNCQLEATAADLGIHVNTVRYRLTRLEERLGVSLRSTKSLAELWWTLRLPGAEDITARIGDVDPVLP